MMGTSAPIRRVTEEPRRVRNPWIREVPVEPARPLVPEKPPVVVPVPVREPVRV